MGSTTSDSLSCSYYKQTQDICNFFPLRNILIKKKCGQYCGTIDSENKIIPQSHGIVGCEERVTVSAILPKVGNVSHLHIHLSHCHVLGHYYPLIESHFPD
jgi:hypothetical protein